MRRMKAVASCAAAFSLVGVLALAACSTAADGGGAEAPPAVQVVPAAAAPAPLPPDRVVALDVRTQQEYDMSHILTARLLPHDAIDADSAAAAAPGCGSPAPQRGGGSTSRTAAPRSAKRPRSGLRRCRFLFVVFLRVLCGV